MDIGAYSKKCLGLTIGMSRSDFDEHTARPEGGRRISVVTLRPLRFLAKRYVQRGLYAAGIWAERATPNTRVLALIERLRLKSPAIPLKRIGPEGDGGYIVPDDLEGIVGCLSPGVAEECGFDLEIAQHGIPVIMADASVDAPPIAHECFRFVKRYVGPVDDGNFVTLQTLAAGVGNGDLLVQMDIEGAEYPVLANLDDDFLRRVRIFVIEFHRLEDLFSASGFKRIEAAFDRLLKFHIPVHAHPNNIEKPITLGGLTVPPSMEFTFLRNDRSSFSASPPTLPRPDDFDNVPGKRPVRLPAIWSR